VKKLEIRDLKKFYSVTDGTLHAVDGVTLDVDTGKTLGIVGESGCGKSTLGKTILRLVEPTSGQILFDGTDISSLSPKEFHSYRLKMQMIFQDPFGSLDPRMTVKQLIAEPMQIYKTVPSKAELSSRVKELMEVVGLASRLEESYPHELDGGRRQRIGIARALSLDPSFIVCDEPVSALDVSIQAQVINLLQDLQKEKNLTYMFITHDLSVVRHISDDICVMYLGQVVELSKSKELFKRPLHPYTQALLSAIPVPRIDNRPKRILLRGEITSPVDPGPGCRFAPRCPHAEAKCFAETPALRGAGEGHAVACHMVKNA
jgi:peptide/nickel transport system ATP-binding protein